MGFDCDLGADLDGRQSPGWGLGAGERQTGHRDQGESHRTGERQNERYGDPDEHAPGPVQPHPPAFP